MGGAAGDFVDVQLHAGRAGKRQRQACCLAACRADRAEQPGVLVALVARRSPVHPTNARRFRRVGPTLHGRQRKSRRAIWASRLRAASRGRADSE